MTEEEKLIAILRDAVSTAQKKRPVKARIYTSLLTITLLTTFALFPNQTKISTSSKGYLTTLNQYNDVSPNPICKDELIVTLNNIPVCPI